MVDDVLSLYEKSRINFVFASSNVGLGNHWWQ